MIREWIIFLIFTLNFSASALVPLESILLGDFEEKYSKESADPFDYLFLQKVELPGKMSEKRDLTIYRGYYEEAINLQKSCREDYQLAYPTPWQEDQVKRSLFATLQYIGLDITIRAIPKYAKYFEFSRDEYTNLVDGLVGNYCSKNLSLISLKQLKRNLFSKFDNENNFKLPDISENSLFPKSVATLATQDDIKEREFSKTLELFKTFCSWGGDIDNLRLMVPLIKSPIIYAQLIRQLTNEKLEWNKNSRNVFKIKNSSTVQVLCEGLICRKTDANEFYKKFPTSVGHKSYDDDLSRLYCKEVRDYEYKIAGQAPKIAKKIKTMSFDEENLLISQFIALQTGMPALFIRANNYSRGKEFLRASVDKSWDQWAMNQIDKFKGEVYYEEPLSVELVDRALYYRNFLPDFKVHFDVNLGELDRTNQIVGKLSTKFNLNFSRKFIRWARNEWINLDPRDQKRKDELFHKMKLRIEPVVENIRSKFPYPPWDGRLDIIIRDEILEQISKYRGNHFDQDEAGMINIPVYINFAPYALKYLRYEYNVEQNQKKSKRDEKLFKLNSMEVKK
ncbi:putative membrane protein [Halobacteriovorax marinus SJ]|uniref:Membrane protein n=1 Tax=Halobacteriovorax marinus (strain ATCC BAA-682 / DSM 15412 / SJ) TaxID=862908 RepID=E1X0D4_HALMS|nr:hypothetical protein [Halobacteriovorax marinus]CBW26362.1 putative membrane protein [Halobacteriovorax marinus SJ]